MKKKSSKDSLDTSISQNTSLFQSTFIFRGKLQEQIYKGLKTQTV